MKPLRKLTIPFYGPSLYRIPTISAGTVPAQVGTVPGEIGPVTWAWPEARFVTGALLIPSSGDPADAALLGLSITDEGAEEIITDVIANDPSSLFAPALASQGLSAWHPLPLQRPVKALDRWIITVNNIGAAPIPIAALLLFFENA